MVQKSGYITTWDVKEPVVNNGMNQLPTSTGDRRISEPSTVRLAGFELAVPLTLKSQFMDST